MQERPEGSEKLAGAVILTVVVALSPVVARAGDSLCGRVTAVKSADILTLDYGAGSYDIRVAGFEIERDEGSRRGATQHMTDLLLGKFVRLRFDGRTAEGEMVGRIWIDDADHPERGVRDAGLELVRAGVARSRRAYTGYKYGEMTEAEGEARKARRGLWSRERVQ